MNVLMSGSLPSHTSGALVSRPAQGSGASGVDTIIVSDIHLGSKVSRAKKLAEIIQERHALNGRYLFNRIVLLGDIFDHHDIGRLADEHWDFLSLVRSLSDPSSGVEVIWLEGNHDPSLEKVAEQLAGAKVLRDYEWDYAGKRFLATHGDRFDVFIEKNPRVAMFFSRLYEIIQRLDFGKRRTSRFLKRASKKLYLQKNFHGEILSFARERSANAVFCGHTHHAEHVMAPDGIAYYNTGCWTDFPSTYVTIGEHGVHIREVW